MTFICPHCGAPVQPTRGVSVRSTDGGTLRVDLDGNRVLVGDEWRRGTPIQIEILHVLARRSPGMVLRGVLFDAVYGQMPEAPLPGTLDTHLCNARKLISGSGWKIEVAWGSGWRLVRAAS